MYSVSYTILNCMQGEIRIIQEAKDIYRDNMVPQSTYYNLHYKYKLQIHKTRIRSHTNVNNEAEFH